MKEWFARPEAARGEVPGQVSGALGSAAAVNSASERVWEAYHAGAIALGWAKDLPQTPTGIEALQFPAGQPAPKLETPALTEAGKEMPFVLVVKGRRGPNGWPLFISMHGGGAAGSPVAPHGWNVNNREWQAQMRLCRTIYPDGLYFIPRMADDNDGRWWFDYCQAIYDRVIRRALLFQAVDPNRVYVMGISEGGYAAYRLGAHMADRWAGSCALAAAEPLATSPPENFRNLPFRCGIGEKDTMFDRIGLARRFFDKLEALQQAEGTTNVYIHWLDVQPGRGHGIDYKPGPLWMAQFVRNPWPRRVVWTVQPLHHTVRRQMYWLSLEQAPQETPLYLTAAVAGNVVTLTARQSGANGERTQSAGIALRIYLNDHLADLDRPVKVVLNGQVLRDGLVPRRISTLARSLNERGDPCYMFPAEIEVNL